MVAEAPASAIEWSAELQYARSLDIPDLHRGQSHVAYRVDDVMAAGIFGVPILTLLLQAFHLALHFGKRRPEVYRSGFTGSQPRVVL